MLGGNDIENKKWYQQPAVIFSGLGTSIVMEVISNTFKKSNNILMFWNKYGNIVLLLIIAFLSFFLWNIIVKYKYVQNQEKDYNDQLNKFTEYNDVLESKIEQLSQQLLEMKASKEADESEIEQLSQQLSYEEYLIDFYMNLSCDFKELKDILITVVHDREPVHTISDKVFSRVLNLISNTNQIDETQINISTFIKQDDYYCIKHSKWHKGETKRKLQLDENSFVGWVFSEKKIKVHDDLNIRCSNFNYDVSDMNFKSILGIPFVVENNCKMVLCLTSKKENCFNQIVQNYESPLSLCTELIGLELLMDEVIKK